MPDSVTPATSQTSTGVYDYQPPTTTVVVSSTPPTPPMSSTTSAPVATAAMPNTPKPKSKVPLKYMIGGLLIALLLVALGAAYWLTQQSQDVRQQASESSIMYSGDWNGNQCVNPNGCDAWVQVPQ